ncbi:hypothetical protein SAMN04487869_107131 [Marinobacter sp. DSM 26671]|jgi:hypothetical protein|uniref:Transmembrane protein n=1 Tax=Marinobacter adhaerens TaxID=1033846 RepID=A0A354JMD6_9GAMM|nr:hypothetical protein [Marinobacter sp. DSM 26671]PHS45387.1 MAG: hypothetical protein COB05_15630 [Marinobacter sp.]SFE40776.1 hypothetical protein SAMN04487869_107131 [Marinobacter sp. DSM 26671]HBC33059.1 hypothetical protein [Marinobacter adhaerens]HBI78924.1 hypothetical protein [Marinobacter adhaerens]|tara:strand:+ start:1116 stop:4442 length:3327 start_codon:yes stop_codon:yes gene_type:complete
MTDTLDFSDESRERSILRRAEYDDTDPRDLMLVIPTREGGKLRVPLLERARSNIEREDYQENTLLRVKPLAEIASNLPVKSGGIRINQGRGVALLRPGFLYIFRNNRLWRELEINEHSQFSDVDLEAVRTDIADPKSGLHIVRPSVGQWIDDLLIPVFLQGRAVMNDFRMAYSEVQWDWSYLEYLEENESARNLRTTAIGHAWALKASDLLTFSSGFPASRIEDVVELRERDLGLELMLENPSDFVVGFKKPGDHELCTKLGNLLETPFDLTCDPGNDHLAHLRSRQGVTCVSLPDPLFVIRHAMTQLHLALHYLDAVEMSVQNNPLAHSAMLIRQAVFDPRPGESNPFSKYSSAIDRSKLDEVLKTSEKDHAIAVIDRNLAVLRPMLGNRTLDSVLEDYRTCNDVAICEGYLLIADALILLQQIPGVLRAQGVADRADILSDLRRWIVDGSFLMDWAPDDTGNRSDQDAVLDRIEALVDDKTEIDDALLKRLNLQSLVYLEKQLDEQNGGVESGVKGVANAGKVSGMVSSSLNEWSSSILTVCKRLIEDDSIQQVDIQRIMGAAYNNFVRVDRTLQRIDIMTRAGAVTSGSIVGVSGNGLVRGLTDFDRSKGVLTRAKDYLYADLFDDSGKLVASSSPSRVAGTIDEAINKIAGDTSVFYAPSDHPEVRKLSLVKVDLAKRANDVVDGPAVSRGLVALAAFNLFVELHTLNRVSRHDSSAFALSSAKIVGATTDLVAASLKLSEVMGCHVANLGGETSRIYRVATRPLFDIKNWPLIGKRLTMLKVSTLVRVTGLATFLAGSAGAGLSYWEMRISLANKDFDAANGHAIAVAGSIFVLASPLMNSLLAIPGWGWAIFGLGLAVGGSLYAGLAADDDFEQLLKRGPWGYYPDNSLPGRDDESYYSQLLSLLSPIHVTAQRYSDVEPEPALAHPSFAPRPNDYVITIQTPLVSRLRLHRNSGEKLPEAPFRLVVQEVAYISSTSQAPSLGLSVPVTSTQMLKATQLTKVTARQSLPDQSAVRFLVRREITESDYQSLYYQESVTTRVRVGIQATLDTELGPLVFPTPVFEEFEPFDLARHSQPPIKEKRVLNPYSQPKSPYWYFTEVSA